MGRTRAPAVEKYSGSVAELTGTLENIGGSSEKQTEDDEEDVGIAEEDSEDGDD